MRELNPMAAIGRAVVAARKLSREDLAAVIRECTEEAQMPEHRRAAAYVEETYAALAGEDRRYLTTKLKDVLKVKWAAVAPATVPPVTPTPAFPEVPAGPATGSAGA